MTDTRPALPTSSPGPAAPLPAPPPPRHSGPGQSREENKVFFPGPETHLHIHDANLHIRDPHLHIHDPHLHIHDPRLHIRGSWASVGRGGPDLHIHGRDLHIGDLELLSLQGVGAECLVLGAQLMAVGAEY